MAQLTGFAGAFDGDTSNIDTATKHIVGSRAFDKDGNEYIYLKGVASTVAGSAVTYDEDYLTTLTVANAVGPIAIAMAAVVASRWGWYQVRGEASGLSAAAVADNKTLYLTATAGKVDDADVGGDAIMGMWSRSAPSGAAAITLQLDYPKVHDIAFD